MSQNHDLFPKDKNKHSRSLTEIANELGITRQGVHLIEKRALKKFRVRFMKLYPDTAPLISGDVESGRW